jgi:outer membrane protein OmpA-like peptidoglycan-associated protein
MFSCMHRIYIAGTAASILLSAGLASAQEAPPGTSTYHTQPIASNIVRDTVPHNNGSPGEFAGAEILLNSNTPRITADGRTMFFNSTAFNDRAWAQKRPGRNEYDSDIYYAVRTRDVSGADRWSTPVNLGREINSSEDDAVEAISSTGDRIYFSSLAPGWLLNGGPFFTAELDGAALREKHGLGGGITEFFVAANRFKIYGSAINADGDAFYFATTGHSPTGDHQIWVSYLRNGTWSYPQNLGSMVNADGGSFAPFIASDGRTLYFSSGRRGGYGGDDVYMTVMREGAWEQPQNVGPDVNSTENEAFFTIPASGDRVYFSKVATDGSMTTIQAATVPQQYLPQGIVLLNGTVVDRATCLPVRATITVEDLSDTSRVQTIRASGIDNRFVVVLQPGRDYGVSVSAPGYAFHSMRFTIPPDANYREVRREIPIDRVEDGMTVALNNIFFDYNADSLRPESRPELDRLIEMLRRYPSMRIVVGGRTDDIGSRAYNLRLSKRRAEAVRRYMIAQGAIEPTRIRAVGYGAAQPLAPNSSEEGRQQNRSVEFAVTLGPASP